MGFLFLGLGFSFWRFVASGLGFKVILFGEETKMGTFCFVATGSISGL